MILASDWVAFHADRTPERTALLDEYSGRRFTYGDLHARVDWLAGYLRREWHLRAGDVVALLAKNSTDYFEVQFACWRLGAILLPLNWRLTAPELLFILNDSGARGLIYDAEFTGIAPALMDGSSMSQRLRIDVSGFAPDDAPAYEDALSVGLGGVVMNPQTTHDTPVIIMYTAGTTGHPKGVLITHGMMLYNAINISTPTGLSYMSRQYVVLPTFHIGGLNLYANPLIHNGGSCIVARQYDPARALQVLSQPEYEVTHFFGVPAIYLFLSQHPDFDRTDLSRIQSWGCGGAPLPVALLEKYARRDIIIQLGFGMTETSPTVFLNDKHRALKKPSSVGKPLMHTRVRVVDEHFADVAPGEVGEVVISGPNVTPGYHNRPEANANSFTVDGFGNRWLHSGDAGMVDEEGCIYIVDRYKDMYISGGENVYPAEVEQVLFQIDGVADAAVIGVHDDRWGESGMAILVLREGATVAPDQVIAHCTRCLAKFKVPKHVAFIDALPRNAAGKVLKRVLREQFAPPHESSTSKETSS